MVSPVTVIVILAVVFAFVVGISNYANFSGTDVESRGGILGAIFGGVGIGGGTTGGGDDSGGGGDTCIWTNVRCGSPCSSIQMYQMCVVGKTSKYQCVENSLCSKTTTTTTLSPLCSSCPTGYSRFGNVCTPACYYDEPPCVNVKVIRCRNTPPTPPSPPQ